MIGRARLLAVVAASMLGAVGCPMLLSDDFHTVPRSAREGGVAGDAASAQLPDGALPQGSGGEAAGGAPSTGGRSTGATGNGGNGGGGATASQGGDAGRRPLVVGATDAGAGDTDACAPCSSSKHWVAMRPPDAGFVAREQAASVAVGTGVFVWGGADARAMDVNDGAVYDSELDTWTSVATDAATPSARVFATAVWTGKSIVVWGGGDHASLTDYATGAVYDPVAKKWTAMSTSGAPTPRRAPFGVWTGSRVLFWGGITATHAPVSGAYLYDPASDAWSPASTTGEPVAPLNPTAGWTGSELVIYGGRAGGTSYTGKTYAYDVMMDAWLQRPAGPQARAGAFGAWDGATFVAWGGTSSTIKKDGQRYSLTQNSWTNMTTTGAPSPRYAANGETGWSARAADTVTLMLGGYDAAQNTLTDGAYYDSKANVWTSVEPWPSGSAHLGGAGAWTGSAFVLWGGRVAQLGELTAAGEIFRF